MKTKSIVQTAAALLLLTFNSPLTSARAENTVFTYQGRVTSGGNAFTGTGQFKFALVTSTNLNHTATAVASIAGNGTVNIITVTDPGSGYTSAPTVTFSGGGGSGAVASAAVSGGQVVGIYPIAFGSYTSAPTVTLSPPPPNYLYTTYWSNDGTSSPPLGEPVSSVSVPVTNGLFTVVLGDPTLANMTAINAALFSQPNLQLRIWFNDGVNGSAALSPLQNLAPTPYAIQALNANTASNLSGTISTAQLSGTIPTTQLSGTLPVAQLPAGVLTNNATGVSLSGTFGGNGNGLFNLNAASLVGSLPASYAIGTAITNTSTLVTITQPGSYYLTHNISVSAGDAIDINANDVTLDLNGFTLFSTEAAPTGTGIMLSWSVTDIIIRNGHIRGGVGYNYNSGVYTGSGFANGISFPGGLGPTNVLVSGVSVLGCLVDGINLPWNSDTVESCKVSTVGSTGISAKTVFNSSGYQCGGNGIFAGHADNCEAQSTGNYAFFAYNANNCSGTCSGNGIALEANTAINCIGTCYGNGDGVDAYTANNCFGYANGSGNGLAASQTATGCYGSSVAGTGLSAVTANNCYGESGYSGHPSPSHGLYAGQIATGCFGQSFGSGTGLWAYNIAIGCYGTSASGTGIRANILNSCVGSSYLFNNKYNMP